MTRPRLRSPHQPFWLRFCLGLLEVVASLELAVVLIGGAALVLALATLVESAYGDTSKSGAANWAIYQTRWFAILNGLLAVNVLCAAVIRFPWKKSQTGFLMTHAGLLLILGGALATRLYGVDANVSILEGTSQWRAIEDAQHFKLAIEPGSNGTPAASQTVNVPFVPGPFNWDDHPTPWWLPLSSLGRRDQGVLYDRDGVKLEALDYYSDSAEISVPRLVLWAGAPGASDAGGNLQAIALEVKKESMVHMGARPYGAGDRKPLAGGQRVAFWMTGDPRETEAFGKILPDGELGAQGQLVLYAGGQRFTFAVDQLKAGARRKLGQTGLEMALVRVEAQFGGAVLSIYGPGEPQRMVLLADMPEHNHQDYRHGVFGAYWLRSAAKPSAADAEKSDSEMHAQAARPRVDVLQGADQKLYARAWRWPRVDPVVPLPADGHAVVFWKGTPDALQLRVDQFLPSPAPETRPAAIRFLARKPLSAKQARVRVRLTVDGRAEEFWLSRLLTDPGDSLPADEQRTVAKGGRRVSVVLVPDEVDLGFRVRLVKFNRKLDPGTGQASYYSSTVDILDRHDDKPLRRDVLITLNEPVNFSDPVTGRSFRLYQASFSGPFKPGDPAFESVAGTTDRDQVFASVLSANYDPGRGMKYAGSLLIVAGVFLIFYRRVGRVGTVRSMVRGPRGTETNIVDTRGPRGTRPTLQLLVWLACFAVLACSPAVAADKPAPLDWSAWRRMPVFIEGRIMPLDSFARDTVEAICGRTRPKLSLAGAGSELTAARMVLPEGNSRRFEPYELLFSWLVEPEKWENVPFLSAEHGQLRQELLGQPLLGPDGERLKYVSPRQVERATSLEARLRKAEHEQNRAQANYDERPLTGVDKKASELYQALRQYRLLTFQPAGPLDPRARSYGLLVEAVEKWRGIEEPLEQLQAMPGLEGSRPIVARAQEKMKRLVELAEAGEKFAPGAVEPLLVDLRTATGQLAAQYKKLVGRLFSDPDKALPQSAPHSPEELRQIRAKLQELATGLADASRLFDAAQHALYDSGRALRLVPALNPAALEGARDTSDQSQPWLSLQTILFGSPAIMARYPQAELARVRKALADVKAAYLDRAAADRPARFASAMDQFAQAVRALGEKLEPARRSLAIAHRDEAILNATAYPSPGAVAAELHYNDVDPFFWSWLVNLLALATLALAFGILRKPMFWLGIAVLVAGQVLTCYGFGLRTYVTGWAPVTGMFESVVFVALVAAMLGLWFTLQPLVGVALGGAWRITAVPGTWEAGVLTDEDLALLPRAGWRLGQWASIPLRLALMAAVCYVLAWYPYGSDGKSAIISLWPRTDVGSSVPSVMDVVTWLVGLSVLGVSAWYAPRAALALLPAIVLVPTACVRLGIAQPLERALERKSFAMVGAATAFLVAFVAYYSPLWPKDIGTLMPVLRDRFWLYLHVLTITASYGAGLLGLGLGDIALLYYLLGKYRQADPPRSEPARLPPEACVSLAGFIYKSMQVAVILLAAGTILGGLWADVAWGRFWGWDAKEVWALISLLVYMAILHGRSAGWFGAFGLAAGSVLGASAIIMAWYGVNYWLRTGLHTYAQGGNDQMQFYVFGFVLAQWALLAAAGLRYRLETTRPRQ